MAKKIKPELSLTQIINMSMGFLGIQMAFGLQNGNASRILANLGADVHELSWFWLVAPLQGLLYSLSSDIWETIHGVRWEEENLTF